MADDPWRLQGLTIADFAREVGAGVAAAQRALDETALAAWTTQQTDEAPNGLREIGYHPTWYAIPLAEAEIKLFFHVEEDRTTGKRRILGLPFNAEVQSKTSLRQEGTSQLKLKIVPTPAPARLTTGLPDAKDA